MRPSTTLPFDAVVAVEDLLPSALERANGPLTNPSALLRKLRKPRQEDRDREDPDGQDEALGAEDLDAVGECEGVEALDDDPGYA